MTDYNFEQEHINDLQQKLAKADANIFALSIALVAIIAVAAFVLWDKNYYGSTVIKTQTIGLLA